jgi:hypothetical protein
MGGRGELIRYRRIRALTPKQRETLKEDVIDIIDRASEGLSIVFLFHSKKWKPLKRRKTSSKKRARGA